VTGARPLVHGLLALAVGAAGCFGGHRREYPADWPRRLERQGDACPDLSGAYQSAQVPDPFVTEAGTLQALLSSSSQNALPGETRKDVAPSATAVRLSLEATAGPLGVSPLSSDGTPVAMTRFERGLDFECRDGALELTFPLFTGNANVCAAFARGQVALWRDAEGGLVARSSSQLTCVGGFLGSVHIWKADWARFQPVPSLAEGTGSAQDPGSTPASRKGSPASTLLLKAALAELLFAGHSWWASSNPRGAGWVAVIGAPAMAGYDAGASWTPPAIAVAGTVGVGLYDVYELSKPGYSKDDRFQRTFVAWNAVAITTVVADWLIGGPRPPRSPAVAVVPVDGGAVLVLAGVR
jgi:hypothetical protein